MSVFPANRLLGLFNRFVHVKSILLNLLLVYIGNWLGCLLVAYFLGFLTDIFHAPQYHSFMYSIVQTKLESLSKSLIKPPKKVTNSLEKLGFKSF